MKKDKHNVQVFEDWEQKTQQKYGDATIHEGYCLGSNRVLLLLYTKRWERKSLLVRAAKAAESAASTCTQKAVKSLEPLSVGVPVVSSVFSPLTYPRSLSSPPRQ